MDNITLSIVNALGMMAIACGAVIYWRKAAKIQFKWFWAGAGLWGVAVALKIICAVLTNNLIFGYLRANLSFPSYLILGGLITGVQSSFFEIGLTFLAVLIWRQLGKNASRAIGVGVGAGGIEALLLGIISLIAMITVIAGLPGTEKIRQGVEGIAASTPFFWLLGPAERIIAITCHASSRALVLSGVVNRKPMMMLAGFLIFTFLDAVAGGVQISGKINQINMWWIELSILPFAAISIFILRWCSINWNKIGDRPESLPSTASSNI